MGADPIGDTALATYSQLKPFASQTRHHLPVNGSPLARPITIPSRSAIVNRPGRGTHVAADVISGHRSTPPKPNTQRRRPPQSAWKW